MENDHIEKLFGELKGTFDFEVPADGHHQRFLEKLEASSAVPTKTKKTPWRWKPLSIAAALLIVCSIGFYYSNPSPSIQEQVSKISPELRTLDSDYNKMVQDLLDGGNSKLILSAMITNFQTRIDLLNEVLEQIEEIKNIKNYGNEHITA